MNSIEFNYHLRNLKKNDVSIEKLYDFYYCRIIQYISRAYGFELAKDVAQDFFIHLIDIAEKQSFVKNPTSWVYTCCNNLAKRKILKETRYTAIGDDTPGKEIISEEELYGDLYFAIKQLDQISQNIIKLVYWEGYNQNEVAHILDIKPATIRKKHSRAMNKLKKIVDDVTKIPF